MHRLATVYTLQTDATLASLPATHVALCLTSSGICRRLAVTPAVPRPSHNRLSTG